LVVNTGWIKKKFILQRLKELGLQVVVLNKEKDWATPFVDQWIISDTKNINGSISEVEKFIVNNPQVKIEGVMTFWEDDVLLTSKISDKFNLIGIPYEVAQKARNKFLFRRFCQDNGIKTLRYKLLKNGEEAVYVKKNFDFPVVVKPVYGAASVFVVKVESRDELDSTIEYIKSNISAGTEEASSLSEGLDIMVEEYIDGDEVDIDLLVQNGKVKFFSVTDNLRTNEPFFVETGMAIPSSLPRKNQQELVAMAEEVVEKMGIRHGCIHFEAKITDDGPVPLEANLRMGGDEVCLLIKEAWDVDLVENAAKIALGIYIKIDKPEAPYCYLHSRDFIPDNSGILVELDIPDSIKRKKYVKDFKILKKVGDPILVPPEGYEYLGWVAVSGKNHLDAQDNLNEVMRKVFYRVVKFDPGSVIGRTERKNKFTYASITKNLLTGAAKIERIRRTSVSNLRKLHVGIACNIYSGAQAGEVEQDLMSVGKNIEDTLVERGYKVTFFDFNNLPKVFNELKNSDVDIIFNVCERINDSSLLEPHAAAILDTLQIPYTGSNPFTLGLCIDKIRVKKLLAYHDIPTPRWDYAYTMEDEIDDELRYPLIVKPANTDNSIGITNDSIVTDKKKLKIQLEKIIAGMSRPALVEEYIEGDEYDVSIMGSDETDFRVLPLSRSVFKDMPKGFWHIYPFDAKWKDGNAYDKIIVQRPPKNISRGLERVISEIALDTYSILDCHDYGRVEVRVDDDNNPYILELNPNPSINIGDCVPRSAKLVGMEYGDFIEEIIKMAIRRYKNRPPYYHLQQG